MRNRSRRVYLAVVLLSFVVFTCFKGHGVTFTKLLRRRHKSTGNLCSVLSPKIISSPGGESKERTLLQTRNDWSKDCIISNTTDDNSGCLRDLDLSEKKDCDTSCQESIQRYRKMNIRHACNNSSQSLYSSIWNAKGKLKRNGRNRLHHLIPIENSKLIFCYIPKDGCTSWKRILLTVAGHIDNPGFQTDDIHRLFHKKLRSLASYKVKEAQIRLKTYKKFLFVREPMERMLSLFLDKAVKNRVLPFNESQYEKFLKFIIKQPPTVFPRKFREHWTHASNLCLPCDVSYDFIGRLETSKRDTQYIFDHFIHKNRDRLTMYHEPDHPTNSSDSDKKKTYYEQVSKGVLRKAIDKYHLDYVLFNYDKPLV